MTKSQGIWKSPPTPVGCMETLVKELAQTIANSLPKVLARDLLCLRSRYSFEGIGFFTVTMPSLAGAVERSLETGIFVLNPDLGFAPKKGWKTPAFLQCFFSNVYDRQGMVLENACAYSIYALRQVLNLFKKIERPVGTWCEKSIKDFISRAEEQRPFHGWNRYDFYAARTVMNEVFADFDVRDIRGKHGPGVVADRLSRGEKWDLSCFTPASDWLWPREEYFTPPELAHKQSMKRGTTGDIPARLICVPKTSKTPRLIAAEPSGRQFLQGGLAEKLVSRIERHWMTAGHVNFRDQSINQRLARRGSISQEWSTIDLSDASDTLGHSLVQALFPTSIGIALDVLRSSEVQVDEKTRICPTFYAVMGSALTFPVESIAFYSICVGAVMGANRSVCDGVDASGVFPLDARMTLRSRIDYARARDSVYVYGDDIIVEAKYTEQVLQALVAYGLKPNVKKSYTRGFFRESCGADYYRGTNVRPIYVRKYPPCTKGDVSRRVSYLATGNLFSAQGLFKTAEAFYKVAGRFPVGEDGASYLCRRNHTDVPDTVLNRRNGYRVRWHKDLQRYQIKAPVVTTPKERDDPSVEGRYLAALTRREVFQTPFLESGTGPLAMKTRWTDL